MSTAALTTSADSRGIVTGSWRRPLRIGLLLLGVVGLLMRVPLVAASIGSNDMTSWLGFAERIHRTQVGELYDHVRLFNHPPLMGHFAGAAYALSRWSGVPFEWLFKAPMVLADFAVAWLLHDSWRSKGPLRAALVFAAFSWNPVSILVSAYHGNTDSLCASLTFLSVLLMDRGRFFGSGLALAASINVKLIPVLLIVPLAACLRSRKQLVAFMAGLSIGVLPFLPYLLWHWKGFRHNALAYRSQPKVWGFTLYLAALARGEHMKSLSERLTQFWIAYGALLVAAWAVLVAALRRIRGPSFSARECAACTTLGFLALTPGWGIQYLVYPVAFVFAVSLEHGVWYGIVGGVHAAVMYATLWTGTHPWFSDFLLPQAAGRLYSCLTWMLVLRLLYDLMRGERAAPELRDWPRAVGGLDVPRRVALALRALVVKDSPTLRG